MGGKGSGRNAEGMKEARSHRAANPHVKDAESNAAIMGYLMELYDMPPVDIDDAEAVDARVREWFALCLEHQLKPQASGLAFALGLTRTTLSELASGRNGGSRYLPDVLATIKRAHALCGAYNEAALMETQGNPAGLIFLAKNNHGYRDVQERQEFHVHADIQSLPPAEVAERYRLQAGNPD